MTVIVGGGAAGMAAALVLAEAGADCVLLERNDRLGRKLSATGNGQGNITNTDMGPHRYFSGDNGRVGQVLSAFGKDDLIGFLTSLGGYFIADEEGRVYPSSRQASSVTDLLRFALETYGANVRTGEFVRSAEKRGGLFSVKTDGAVYTSRFLILAAGGKASPHFGTDGNGYRLAQGFGHSVTRLSPALVQLKTDKENIRGLKGVRCDCGLRLLREEQERFSCRGDVIFTDYGVSGNAVFRASSYAEAGDDLSLDFLPDCPREKLTELLDGKAEKFGAYPAEDLLRGIMNSAAAKCVLRSLGISLQESCASLRRRAGAIAARVKNFSLRVEGNMGFENAQVTKGGVPLSETDEYLMSKKAEGLFFAGEILDVDGECGGYNLQWAFSSGVRCARRIAELLHEDR